MSTKTLFLAWQDQREESRQWFPIGRLDVETKPTLHRFRYTGGAQRAQKEAKFIPLLDFPNMKEDYRSLDLFPLFKNRVIASGRPDRSDYLNNLGLSEGANPAEILSVNGGSRVTDAYEVFPKIEKSSNGEFTCQFFLHGWSHVSKPAIERINSLRSKEQLYLTLELTNPATQLAVQIQTTDYHMVGWTPRYLVDDLAKAMAEGPNVYKAHVVRVNPQPAPSKQRVLIEMQGQWEKHEPMIGDDFKPLVE